MTDELLPALPEPALRIYYTDDQMRAYAREAIRDFTTPKTWPQDVRDQIKKIREIAAFGECK